MMGVTTVTDRYISRTVTRPSGVTTVTSPLREVTGNGGSVYPLEAPHG